MKNQKLHSRTCPKLFVVESMAVFLSWSNLAVSVTPALGFPERVRPEVHTEHGVSEPMCWTALRQRRRKSRATHARPLLGRQTANC